MKKDQLDSIDVRILATLQKNGRMTNVRLAKTVGLSPSACLERVKRLEQQRVIMGYGAYLDVDRLGSNITVYVEITLQGPAPRGLGALREYRHSHARGARLPPG